MNDYHKNIQLNKPAAAIYAAITLHIADWWSNDITGPAARVGDSFTIAFGKTQKTMEIVKAVPNQQVIWKCVKAYIDMPSLKNKSEWEGTELIWTLNTGGGNTTTILTFLHAGLNQHFECYSVCEAGWDHFLASLEAYLVTGKGNPFLKSIIHRDAV